MTRNRFTGGCLCGAVRLAAVAAPYRAGICHCLDCRKHHGAVFHTFAIFPAEVCLAGISGLRTAVVRRSGANHS